MKIKKKLAVTLLCIFAFLLASCGDNVSVKGQIDGEKIERNGEVVTQIKSEDRSEDDRTERLQIYDEKRIANASKWDGTLQMVSKEDEIYDFSGGTGSKDEPYLIKSAEDFAHLVANVRYVVSSGWTEETPTCYDGIYFRLECDIDMQGHGWYGVGGGTETWNDDAMFRGIFDGDDHAIYNFALADEPMNGLFSYIGRGAVIKNLHIASGTVEVVDEDPMGLLVGSVRYGATIENCSVYVTLESKRTITPCVGMVGVVETTEENKELVGMFRDCDLTGCKYNGSEFFIEKVAEKISAT